MNKIKGLDTLRFFAFFAIFLFHATPNFKYGYLGVDFFFVLSSFLLTYLTYEEIDRTGSFSKLNFFGRRALRIFPLYYLILLFSFLVIPLIDSSANLPENKLLYYFFLSNYETSDCIYSLKFLWSIAVEEQFYLLFILTSFLLSRKLLFLILGLFLSYFIFMAFALNYGISIYSNTIAHFPNFALGILGGYLYFKKWNSLFWSSSLFVLSLIGTLIAPNEILLNLSISVLFFSLIFIIIQNSHYISNCFMFRLTEKLGTYSYGLYVYSGFVLTFVAKFIVINNPFYRFFIAFSILVTVSILSYHLYEKYFLKLKKYFRQEKIT